MKFTWGHWWTPFNEITPKPLTQPHNHILSYYYQIVGSTIVFLVHPFLSSERHEQDKFMGDHQLYFLVTFNW